MLTLKPLFISETVTKVFLEGQESESMIIDGWSQELTLFWIWRDRTNFRVNHHNNGRVSVAISRKELVEIFFCKFETVSNIHLKLFIGVKVELTFKLPQILQKPFDVLLWCNKPCFVQKKKDVAIFKILTAISELHLKPILVMDFFFERVNKILKISSG